MKMHYYSAVVYLKHYDVEVDFRYWFEPYRPGWFGPDGGEPPSGPDIDIVKLYVKSFNKIDRAWLQDRGWLKTVEDAVWAEISNSESLRESLISNAEADYD